MINKQKGKGYVGGARVMERDGHYGKNLGGGGVGTAESGV